MAAIVSKKRQTMPCSHARENHKSVNKTGYGRVKTRLDKDTDVNQGPR